MLFGGYEAIYHFGNRVDERLNRHPQTFELLAGHVGATFPALDGTRFARVGRADRHLQPVLRYAVIEATRRALARADENGGRRGPWLRVLDRLGLGFDS